QKQLTGIVECRTRVDDVFFEHTCRGQKLPDRTGRIQRLGDVVDERGERVGGYVQVIGDVDVTSKTRIIVAGVADERQDFARLRVDGNDGAGLSDDAPGFSIDEGDA